jgi:2-aminoadipate transaminase
MARRTTAPPISWLMQLTLERPGLISLAAGFTDDETLPAREAKAALTELLSESKSSRIALQYGSTAGDPTLRRLTTERWSRQDNNPPWTQQIDPAKNLLITNGSQQLLYLVAECLCDPGDIVLVEDPTYFVFLGIAQSHGLRCRGITLTDAGMDLAHLEQVLEDLKRSGGLSRVKFLYCVSYFQNPTGRTTAWTVKAGALELLRRYERAAGHPLYLLEDAAYRELRFAGEDVPSTLTFKQAYQRVIYTGTYSKPFATGVRVGFGWLPDALFTPVHRLKGNHDFGTTSLLQQLLVRVLESGQYDRHLEVLRRRYAHKAKIMTAAMQETFPPRVTWLTPRGGLYVWGRAPRSWKTGIGSRVFEQALQQDVLYVPGRLCYAKDPTRRVPQHEMRLSFGNASDGDLRAGIQRLGTVLHAAGNA